MIISLPFPVSVNDAYANVPGRGRVKTARHKTWFDKASLSLAQQLRGLEKEGIPWRDPVTIHYAFGAPDNRRRDCNNYEKVVSDFLVRQVIILDDSLIQSSVIDWSGPAGIVLIRIRPFPQFMGIVTEHIPLEGKIS
jgi:Holliday junction resolvase RusA-like endonuclease